MRNNIFRLLGLCCIALLFAAGCVQKEPVLLDEVEEVPEGYVTISGAVEIPRMQEVATRAIDMDGMGIQNMTLFCFGQYGLFLTTVRATITPTNINEQSVSTTGTFKANIPKRTDRIHFVCNQNMAGFSETSMQNRTEQEVLATLEGSSGMMIFWARFARTKAQQDANKDIAQCLKEKYGEGNPMVLIRNQARVNVDDSATNSETGNKYFEWAGHEVANVYAFGTVAPFNSDSGFPTSEQWAAGNSVWRSVVTLPANKEKLSDLQDVKRQSDICIFEHPNTEEDPVSVIIYGKNEGDEENLYYRVMLLKGDGQPVPIIRNTIYTIKISGPLSFGQPTFEAALTAPATNNVWLSIDDDILTVEDNEYILSVARSNYIFTDVTEQNSTVELPFSLEGKNGIVVDENDPPVVSWLEGNTVASNLNTEFNVSYSNGQYVGKGSARVTLTLPLKEKREGTVLVQKGNLRRKIKVITISKQKFTPSWISTQILGNVTDQSDNSSHVSMMFTIPETCPEEMFPLKVLITAPDLDIRNDDKQLPIIFKGEEGFGSDYGGTGYKYVYTADGPGEHRVYMFSKLPQKDGNTGEVWLEAEHFSEMHHTYQYSGLERVITVANLDVWPNPNYQVDDPIPYYFVPQKKNAIVQFDVELKVYENGELRPVDATNHAVFKVFANNMTPMDDDDEYFKLSSTIDVWQRDVWYFPSAEEEWEKYGKFWWFWQRPQRDNPGDDDYGKGTYTMYLRTNVPRSAEAVRIASLEQGEASPRDLPDGKLPPGGWIVYPEIEKDGYGWGGIGNCGYYGQPEKTENGVTVPGNTGISYRSMIFELANFRPFRFYPEVYRYLDDGTQKIYYDAPVLAAPGEGMKDWGAWPQEIVTEISDVPYGPDHKFDIELDVTSFSGADKKTSVDPFGMEFNIYIDAPMLSIDVARMNEFNLTRDKLRADPSVPGRFIYTVDKKRETEAAFGIKPAKQEDAYCTAEVAALRNKERKRLPFVTSKAVSAGDIVISSDEDLVVYMPKTFTITNASITGKIQYKYESNGVEVVENVPRRSFVTFEKVSDGSRVGSMSITADGQYSLRLRKEYDFSWNTSRMKVSYTNNGVQYTASIFSIADLLDNRDIVLSKADAIVVN